MGDAARLELVLDSRLEEIERLAEQVERFCDAHDLPARCAFQVNLCLDELITNVITHGLDGTAGHAIAVSLQLGPDILSAEIIDDGPAFDPLSAAQPDLTLGIEDRPIGGLGTHFVKTLMSDVAYRREAGFNHLAFSKRLDEPAEK